MDSHALKVIDYPSLLEFLAHNTDSEVTQRVIRGLVPMTCPQEIRLEIDTLIEYRLNDREHGIPAFDGPPDIRKNLDRSQAAGWMLAASEIARIGSVIRSADTLKVFFSRLEHAPLLQEKTELVMPLTELRQRIERSVTIQDEVLDGASDTLRTIRNQIRRAQEKIRSKMEQLAEDLYRRGIVQDQLITIRNNRYVVPVKASESKAVPGIIHDRSASGMTVFVEPQFSVNDNNELAQLYLDERYEIERILTELTAQIGARSEFILIALETLIYLDLLRAKSTLADEMQGQECHWTDKPVFSLKRALNPVLLMHRIASHQVTADQSGVVPIDLDITEKDRLLVITGPNTGGKTVALKTAGLIVCMVQTGLLPPCHGSSTIGVFENMFADIGDEQSLEQSLSTFSGHLKQIVSLLEKADEKSLVLLDELGAGTDPTEGSALGITILSEMLRRRTATIASTHHNSIKAFAFTMEGIANAALEFDMKTLRPTYRILMGQIGQSNAFGIAASLGFPRHLLDEARRHLDGKGSDIQTMLNVIDQQRRAAERQRSLADQEKDRARSLRKAREDVLRHAENEAASIIAKASQKAQTLIADLRQERENLREEIKRLRKLSRHSSSASETTVAIQTATSASDHIQELTQNLAEELIGSGTSTSVWTGPPPKPGDRVGLINVRDPVTVLAVADVGQVSVEMRGKRIKVPIQSLRRLGAEQESQRGKPEVTVRFEEDSDAGASVGQRLNLIGMRTGEAVDELEKYLDLAFRAGIPELTIVHGFGTGRLQDAVVATLKKSPYVATARRGTDREGGGGVTVVEMVKR